MFRKEKHDDFSAQANQKTNQWKTRERGFWVGDKETVNSDFIFNHKDLKKKTKGYDKETGEIAKRGKPSDNPDEIFLKKPEKDKTFAEVKKDKDKNDAKRRQAYNKKLYRDRLKTKWDRGW